MYLFGEYMKARKSQRTVSKILRDQLLRMMHFMHGYQEQDLRLMFHVLVATIRRMLSIKSLLSVDNNTGLLRLEILGKNRSQVITAVKEMIDAKRSLISIPLI